LLFVDVDFSVYCSSPTVRANIQKPTATVGAHQSLEADPSALAGIIGSNKATFRSSIAPHQSTKQTYTAHTIAGYEQ
jgi:hypothetical protein